MTTILDLTPEQLRVVRSDAERLLVSAVPGAGKTHTVAHAIARDVAQRIPAHRILALGFTRAAASNLRRRVAEVAGGSAAGVVDCVTFHELAAREVGCGVASDSEVEAVTRGMFSGRQRLPRRIGHGADPRSPHLGVRALAEAIHEWEAGRCPEPHPTVAVLLLRLAQLGAEYGHERYLPTWGLLDAMRVRDHRTYDRVYVDEVQDCTPRELWLARSLVGADGRLVAVGQADQGLFQWRGACEWSEVEDALEPTARAEMTQSFRFGEEIAAYAGRSGARPVGLPGAESEVYLDRVLPEGMVYPWPLKAEGERVVLCRTNAQCAWVATHLTSEGTPAEHVRRDKSSALHTAAEGVAEAFAAGRVVVSTVHSFKGLEADHVVVVDDERYHSGDPAETRCFYVAVTRARSSLLVARAPEGMPAW